MLSQSKLNILFLNLERRFEDVILKQAKNSAFSSSVRTGKCNF
jgi:hypothetical protein